jgi:hypothetical protein
LNVDSTAQQHHAALTDAGEHCMRAAAAAKAAATVAPDAWRAAVLEQAHLQLRSILARLKQLA